MRTARVKAVGPGYYHVMSRIIERRFVFDEGEREKFRDLLRRAEAFSGVRILTYCIMSNHFHLLVHVPQREEIEDAELLRRLRLFYEEPKVKEFDLRVQDARAEGNEGEVKRLRERYLYRMYDISQFMKTLKQRVSMGYNRKHKRKGTLWEDRFNSVLVEGSRNALVMIATYIDLNPVRAGLVRDPKQYRHSGYGEAVAGNRTAREGLCSVMLSAGVGSWAQAAGAYRKMLYVQGQARGLGEDGKPIAAGFCAEAVQAVLEKGGKLSAADALRCRVRYFSDGVALGSREFVNGVFAQYRDRFGEKRKTGARPMRGIQAEGLYTLRDLRLQAVVPSAGG